MTAICWLFCLFVAVVALDNGLGTTPPMGYNTWNDFRCENISAANIMKVVDRMEALGLRKYGYSYINVDDCWAVKRDPVTHELVPDPNAFPDGMKAVADYVHSKGFLFGIYSDRGPLTCALRPGSHNHEEVDAQTFANWGVDYLKEDSCYASPVHDTAFAQYATMRDALNKTGRPIFFSLCGWHTWYAPVGWSLGNAWRIAMDVNDWPTVWVAIVSNIKLAAYAKPGGWNDPDMLIGSTVGASVALTPAQSRTQFSLWAVMSAPLLIGSNILGMSPYDLETYTNAEVIALNQDALGAQGVLLWHNCPLPEWDVSLLVPRVGGKERASLTVPQCQQTWSKALSGNATALLFVNFGSSPATMVCDAPCLASIGFANGAEVRDLWSHRDLGRLPSVAALVQSDGASVVYLLRSP